MNAKLKAIAAQAADELITKMEDCEEKLLPAIHEHAAAHEEDDKCPAFSIGFAIKLDWDGGKAVYSLSFSQKYKAESAHDIPDPNQPELELGEQEEGGEE